jgi:dTDP-4-dehydrorhamnose reductase
MHLIVGGDSDIGMAISDNWNNNNISFHASTRRISLISDERPYIDLSDENSIINTNFVYDVVIITAGVTSIDECERNPEETRNINVVNTSLLINKLHSQGAYVMFLSSNQVFDGSRPFRKSTDSKNPINEYGKQKSEVEDVMLPLQSKCILRMTKVFDKNPKIIQQWKKKISRMEEIYPFSDMLLAPVDIDIVLERINDLVSKRDTGIYHLASGVDITYEELSRNLCNSISGDQRLIKPVEYSSVLRNGVNYPYYTSLS